MANTNTSKTKQYPFDRQQDRPFISIDRECFRKSVKEKLAIFNFKKLFGKTKHHKFETTVKVQF